MHPDDTGDELLLQAVLLRMATDSGRRWSLEQVATELGVDLELLRSVEGE